MSAMEAFRELAGSVLGVLLKIAGSVKEVFWQLAGSVMGAY